MRALLVFCLIAAAAAQDDVDSRPDLVLILADDVGVEAFAAYGGESYATPHLDAMAREGTRFCHCYSQPLCTPSRVKLMTGRSNIRNYTSFGILPRGERTFAHTLREAGYATCVVGKWQLFGSRPELLGRGAGTAPEAAGFDEHLLWQVDRIGSRYGDPLLVKNGANVDGTAGGYGPDFFTDHAIDFIRRQRAAGRPYLLYFPMALVHSPFEAPPGSDPGPRGKAGRQQRFAAMMRHMDAIVGRITAAIDAAGGKDRTLVLFSGDNGTARNIDSKCAGRIVTGGKGLPNDRGTHVPLLARWPGTVPAGHESDALVDFSDFYPTLCAAAGAAPPSEPALDGRSFLPQLRGGPGSARDAIFVYWNPRPERPNFARGRFARDRRYKLYGDGRFYDLHSDPEEERPIDAAIATAAAAAHQKLADKIASMPAHPERIAEQHR